KIKSFFSVSQELCVGFVVSSSCQNIRSLTFSLLPGKLLVSPTENDTNSGLFRVFQSDGQAGNGVRRTKGNKVPVPIR
ncbi:MAG: hypothetical protein JW849_06935, partial [Phycisphaerae bacterium]|nr:hypothetical protein [Phycisphaerae bacterium]